MTHARQSAVNDTVAQILADMQPVDGEPLLEEEQMNRWVAVLKEHSEPGKVAAHLVALAMRFTRQRAMQTVHQLALLAMVSAGADEAQNALAEAGQVLS